MAQIPDTWKEQRTVEPFDVDVRGRLRPQTLFGYLLNAASKHAETTPYGYDGLAARDLMWVLVKLQLSVARQPMRGDRVTLETWSKGAARIYALRDYEIASESGARMAAGSSAWLLINKASGRPERFDALSHLFPSLPGRSALETNVDKVRSLQAGEHVARFRVLFSDIDMNRHVNSARYLQWIVDSHDHDQLEASELAAVEMSFLAEALPNDEVAVFAEHEGGRELCAVRRLGDGKELCRAALDWRASR